MSNDVTNRDLNAAVPSGDPACSGRPVPVLLVVPTLNEANHIQAVLTDLLEGEQGAAVALALNVVVVDGGSTDETCRIVERMSRGHPNLQLLFNRARIQSAAVNLAVRHYGAGAEVLVRCDAHAAYPARYCSSLVETLLRTGADSVVVPMDSIGDSGLQRAVAWLSNCALGTGGSAHRAGRRSGFVDHGHHAAFRLEFFRRVGGYDESFTHNEDAELDCRQRALGARIFLDSRIRVVYRPRSTFRSLWQQYFKYGAGRSRTIRRHPASLRVRQLAVPGHLMLTVITLAFALAVGSPWLLVWPALYLSLLALFSIRVALRERSLTGLLLLPAAATMHTAWASGFFTGMLAHRESVWRREMAAPLPIAAGDGS